MIIPEDKDFIVEELRMLAKDIEDNKFTDGICEHLTIGDKITDLNKWFMSKYWERTAEERLKAGR